MSAAEAEATDSALLRPHLDIMRIYPMQLIQVGAGWQPFGGWLGACLEGWVPAWRAGCLERWLEGGMDWGLRLP